MAPKSSSTCIFSFRSSSFRKSSPINPPAGEYREWGVGSRGQGNKERGNKEKEEEPVSLSPLLLVPPSPRLPLPTPHFPLPLEGSVRTELFCHASLRRFDEVDQVINFRDASHLGFDAFDRLRRIET